MLEANQSVGENAVSVQGGGKEQDEAYEPQGNFSP